MLSRLHFSEFLPFVLDFNLLTRQGRSLTTSLLIWLGVSSSINVMIVRRDLISSSLFSSLCLRLLISLTLYAFSGVVTLTQDGLLTRFNLSNFILLAER